MPPSHTLYAMQII